MFFIPSVHVLTRTELWYIRIGHMLDCGHKMHAATGFIKKILPVQIRTSKPSVAAVGVEGLPCVYDTQIIEYDTGASW